MAKKIQRPKTPQNHLLHRAIWSIAQGPLQVLVALLSLLLRAGMPLVNWTCHSKPPSANSSLLDTVIGFVESGGVRVLLSEVLLPCLFFPAKTHPLQKDLEGHDMQSQSGQPSYDVKVLGDHGDPSGASQPRHHLLFAIFSLDGLLAQIAHHVFHARNVGGRPSAPICRLRPGQGPSLCATGKPAAVRASASQHGLLPKTVCMCPVFLWGVDTGRLANPTCATGQTIVGELRMSSTCISSCQSRRQTWHRQPKRSWARNHQSAAPGALAKRASPAPRKSHWEAPATATDFGHCRYALPQARPTPLVRQARPVDAARIVVCCQRLLVLRAPSHACG